MDQSRGTGHTSLLIHLFVVFLVLLLTFFAVLLAVLTTSFLPTLLAFCFLICA